MASTYTTSLKIQQIGNGEQSGVWGTTTNTNWTLVEQAITGTQTITMSNANYTLTNLNGTLDEARNATLVITGTNSGVYQVIAPLVNKTYIISNQTTGGYAITIGGTTGSVVTIPNGLTTLVYCDGINFYTGISGLTGNQTIQGNLSITGNETVSGTLGVTGAATFTGAAALNGGGTSTTPSSSDSSTKIATTAFVRSIIPSGVILMWSGSVASIPTGWYLCDGTNSTPDLRNRFIVGAGSTYSVGGTGGSADATLVSHTHTATSSVTDPGHNHTANAQGVGPSITGGSGNFYSTSGNTGTSTTGITVATSISTVGSSATNANLPPYYALCYIMKS